MPDTTVDIGSRTFAAQIADAIHEARTLIGWSQRELASRAETSHATVWRIEGQHPGRLDLLVVERLLRALGIRLSLGLDTRHLADRRRQRDAVHAWIVGYVARRLERTGWRTAIEVPLGHGVPRGWIDLLALRDTDGALLVDETKTDLPDLGALGRSLAFYEREAWDAARAIGWRPRRAVTLVTALDSAVLAGRLVDNRDLVRRMFPAPVDGVAEWLAAPGREPPGGWSLAMVDPATRNAAWLRPTVLTSRRRPPAYADYAAAALRRGAGLRGPGRRRS